MLPPQLTPHAVEAEGRDLDADPVRTLTGSKTDDPIFKWAKDLNRYFAQQDTQEANIHT